MTMRMTSIGLPAALLAASLFGACQNTARGLEQDTENNAAKAKAASQDAATVAERAAHDTKEAVARAADATKDAASEVAQKTRDAAKDASAEAEQKSKTAATMTASALDAAAVTTKIKTALIADKSVDASDIDVDTNGSTRTVTLKGHVPTAAQKPQAERIAKDKAPGYEIVNMLALK
jgi:hyperosmotically inducible protein